MTPLPINLIRIEKFSEVTGYTPSAVRGKIATGAWVDGVQYVRAPDGHILINLEAYHKWAEGQESVCAETVSRSASTGEGRDSNPRFRWNQRRPISSTPNG